MDLITIGTVVSLLTAIGALIINFRKAKVDENLSDSQITEKITGAASVMLDKMQAQLTKQEAQIIKLEAEIIHLQTEIKGMELKAVKADREVQMLRKGVNKLIDQIRKLGEEPCWVPDDL